MQEHTTVWGVLRSLATRPRESLLRRWNWKSAVMSSLVRGAIFFSVNLKAGIDAATAAMLTEFAFRAATAGFYGALTQAFRRVEPPWQGALSVLILLPFANHSLEFLVHWWRGTAELWLSIAASVAFTALSSTFNLFVMRRGAMVVGAESESLLRDLSRMPLLVAAFLWLPFRGLRYLLRVTLRAQRSKRSLFPDEGAF